jgi:CheY-like chemotaxis protein
MKMASRVLLLVVEDEIALAQMYSDRFKMSGFDVDVAHEGEEALNKMAAEHPSIVLMDILMPGLSGTEAVEQAKANPATRDIPIVMLTNYPDSIDLKNALKLGAAGYIIKSEATPEQVVEKIQKILAPKPVSGQNG